MLKKRAQKARDMGARTAEAFARTTHELQQERASALGRIGRALDEALAAAGRIRARLAEAGGDPRALLAEYRIAYARVLRYRWYLEVQREANGLRSHRLLDETCPLPPDRILRA